MNKKEILNKIWFVVICMFILIIMVGTIYKCRNVSIKIQQENLFSQIGSSFENHLFGKGTMAFVDNNTSWILSNGNAVNANRTIIGLDDWLFLRETIEREADNRYYSAEELEKFGEYYILEREKFEKLGCEYVFLIAPDKARVYEEFVPEYYTANKKESLSIQLCDYLKEEKDVNVLYPLNELLAHKEQYKLFYKLDTHWNTVAAYIATQEVMAALGYEKGSLTTERVTEAEYIPQTYVSNDLTRMANLESYYVDSGDYEIEGAFYTHIEIESESFVQNKNAPIDKKVLFIRDSFGVPMVHHLSAEFTQVYQVHDGMYTDDVLEAFKPDIVIREIVERRLSE